MTDTLHIHPANPQPRLLQRVVEVLQRGGVIAYPTDSAYALGCHLGDKEAMQKIRDIRQVDKQHNFTLMCRDLSELATYARVDNATFRFLKAHTPGAYTFILNATREVPKRLQHPKRKTIGLRVPDHPIVLGLLEMLNEPLMSGTLQLPGDDYPLVDTDEILERLNKKIDLMVDGGACGLEPTTVIDLTEGEPEVLRQGKGVITF